MYVFTSNVSEYGSGSEKQIWKQEWEFKWEGVVGGSQNVVGVARIVLHNHSHYSLYINTNFNFPRTQEAQSVRSSLCSPLLLAAGLQCRLLIGQRLLPSVFKGCHGQQEPTSTKYVL